MIEYSKNNENRLKNYLKNHQKLYKIIYFPMISYIFAYKKWGPGGPWGALGGPGAPWGALGSPGGPWGALEKN